MTAEDTTMRTITAFAGARRIATGSVEDVALAAHEHMITDAAETVLVFDDLDARPVELDLRGTVEDVLARIRAESGVAAAAGAPEQRRGPGRPRLGVVGREVTLLPRHWEWLATQPGGASVALRKLVEQARRESQPRDRIRAAQEAAYRFMSAAAGNEPGYEEACRALFAGDADRFDEHTSTWSCDVASYARRLAGPALVPAGPGRS